MASCTQQNTPSPNNNNNGGGSTSLYNIDSSYFFKINFQNKALYNYAVRTNNIILGNSGATGAISTTTISGIISTSFQINAANANAIINHATCSALGFFSKSGNAIGIYKASNQLPSQIIDLATSKTYVIDTATSSFNVTSVGLHNFTGTFSCKLIDGTSLIPATGSFNLYKP
jgi:hypothetical protein